MIRFAIVAFLLFASPVMAQKVIMEGVPSSRYTIKVDTINARVDIDTTSYNWGIADVGLHVTSNIVIDTLSQHNACVIYATGSITCQGVTLGGVGSFVLKSGDTMTGTLNISLSTGTVSPIGDALNIFGFSSGVGLFSNRYPSAPADENYIRSSSYDDIGNLKKVGSFSNKWGNGGLSNSSTAGYGCWRMNDTHQTGAAESTDVQDFMECGLHGISMFADGVEAGRDKVLWVDGTVVVGATSTYTGSGLTIYTPSSGIAITSATVQPNGSVSTEPYISIGLIGGDGFIQSTAHHGLSLGSNGGTYLAYLNALGTRLGINNSNPATLVEMSSGVFTLNGTGAALNVYGRQSNYSAGGAISGPNLTGAGFFNAAGTQGVLTGFNTASGDGTINCQSNPSFCGLEFWTPVGVLGTWAPRLIISSTNGYVNINGNAQQSPSYMLQVDSGTIYAQYGVVASTGMYTGLVTAGSFLGVSGATETTTAALIGVGTAANPLGVNSSSIAVLGSTGFVLNVNIDGSSITKLNSSGLVPNTLLDGSSVTKQGNIFNGNTQLVQTTSGGLLPIISGANLTGTAPNFTAGNVSPSASSLVLIGASTQALNGLVVGNGSGFTISTNAVATATLTVQGANFSVGGSTFIIANGGVNIGGTGAANGVSVITLNSSNNFIVVAATQAASSSIGILGYGTANTATKPTANLIWTDAGYTSIGVGNPSKYTTGKALEVGFTGNSIWAVDSGDTFLTNNVYYNSGYKYARADLAEAFNVSDGGFEFRQAISGSADATITWTTNVAVKPSGVIVSSTTMGTASCTAGTPTLSVTATDQHGTFTAGTLATACTYTFKTAWPKTPDCICQGNLSTINVVASATSVSAVTCTGASALTGDVITYFCWGAP